MSSPRAANRASDDEDRAASLQPAPSGAGPIPPWAYYVFLVRGAVALALGAALLLAGTSLTRLATFLALYWIIAALLTLRWAGAHRGAPGRRLGLLAGGLGLVAGITLLVGMRLGSVSYEGALLDFLGLSAAATGILRLSGRFHDDELADALPRRRYRLAIGGLEVLLGAALVIADDRTSDDIRIALAVWGLATGTFLLLDALVLRRVARSQGRQVDMTTEAPPGRPGW